jgi:hypothetical protein
MAQLNVEAEKRIARLESTVESLKNVTDTWLNDIKQKIKLICKRTGLSQCSLLTIAYNALEKQAHCHLKARQTKTRQLMKQKGATTREINGYGKINVIAADTKLRTMFEDILNNM